LLVTGNKVLRVLSLGDNLITDVGCTDISEMLESNSTNLKELKLNWNNIMMRGGITIAHALRHNNHLKVLDLSWNSIGSGGNTPTEVGLAWT
jgi:Ran GTPase-activating protein (RanGAP) involved in mRNA processing and transport